MLNISFGANYIDKINILKKDRTNKYYLYSANLVKLDKTDLNALKEINKAWNKNYFGEIFIDWAQTEHKKNNNLYAVTTQEKDFNNLLAGKVLGLMNLSLKKRSSEIYFIETKKVNGNENKEFDRVGTSLINYVKTKTERIKLFAFQDNLVENFYKRLGFVNRCSDKKTSLVYGELIWIKNPTKLDMMQISLQKHYNSAVERFRKSRLGKVFNNCIRHIENFLFRDSL